MNLADGGAKPSTFDVLVIGGAFSGAAAALLLKRQRPQARIAIVERRAAFDRKVGEATVEVSAFFLHQVLGLYDYLSREQLPKHGLRFWFHDRPDRRLAEMSEVGPCELPAVPSFQLDRARLDEHLLGLAVAAGCELFRPATIEALELAAAEQRIAIRDTAGRSHRLAGSWIIDASGREGVLAQQLGLRDYVDRHPTGALWGRWRGVRDLDGIDMADSGLRPVPAARRLATNHFLGRGYWCWAIPLRGGETSIGLVFDRRMADFFAGGKPRAVYEDFVRTAPGLRELTQDAAIVDDDFAFRRRLAYIADRYAGPGWACVGDAASFLDPFYSPGLDHAAMSIYATVGLVARELAGELPGAALDGALAAHNAAFARSLPRWLDAIYTDKYELMGDAELMRASFLVDTALYYLAVAGPIYRDQAVLAQPTFSLDRRRALWAARFMTFFKGRLVRIARQRQAIGSYGRRNAGWQAHGRAFDFGVRSARHLLRGLTIWLGCEVDLLLAQIRRPDRQRSLLPGAGPLRGGTTID